MSTNPQEFVAPAASAAREGINQNYTGVADSLRQNFMSGGGGGASGKFGGAALSTDLARRGALANSDANFAATAAALPVTAAGLSENFLNTNLGQTSAGTSATTGTGTTGTTTTGTSTTSGQSSSTGSEKGSSSGTKVGGGVSL